MNVLSALTELLKVLVVVPGSERFQEELLLELQEDLISCIAKKKLEFIHSIIVPLLCAHDVAVVPVCLHKLVTSENALRQEFSRYVLSIILSTSQYQGTLI